MRRIATLTMAGLLLSVSITAQTPTPPTRELAAHSILNALYPELLTTPIVVQTTNWDGRLQLHIGRPLGSPLERQRALTTQPWVTADVQFDSTASLTSLRASGPLLKSAENARLRSKMANAANADSVLTTERAAFRLNTGTAVQQQAPLAALEKVLGALSIGDATLRTVARNVGSEYGAVWEMAVSTTQAGRAARQYAISFEPYDGRVVGIVAR
jgi:hypothetical protein